MGQDNIASVISSVHADIKTGSFMEARIVNPECQVDWSKGLTSMYNSSESKAWKKFHFKRFWPQMLVAARPEAVQDMQRDYPQHALTKEVTRWWSGQAGVVRAWNDVGEEAEMRDMPVWKTTPTWSALPRVTTLSTTAARCSQLVDDAAAGALHKAPSKKADKHGKELGRKTIKGLGGVNQLLVLGFNCWNMRSRKSYVPDMRVAGGKEGCDLWEGGVRKYNPLDGLIRARNPIWSHSHRGGTGPMLPTLFERNILLKARDVYGDVERDKVVSPRAGSLALPALPSRSSAARLVREFNAAHADAAQPTSVRR